MGERIRYFSLKEGCWQGQSSNGENVQFLKNLISAKVTHNGQRGRILIVIVLGGFWAESVVWL